jgi:hypothetical protein
LLLAALLWWLLAGGRAAPEAAAPAAPQGARPDIPLAPQTVQGLDAPPRAPAAPQAASDEATKSGQSESGAAPARQSHLPVVVEAIDASSGRPLAAAWAFAAAAGSVPAEAPGIGSRLLPVADDGAVQVEFAVHMPPGFAPWDEPRIRTTAARRARALRHVHPLRPEVRATLVVNHPDGRRARDVTVDAGVAGRRVTVQWDPLAASGRLAGLPFLRGERIQLLVRELGPGGLAAADQGLRAALWEARLGEEPHGPLFAEVTLPAEVPDPPIGLAGGAGGPFLGRFDQRYLLTKGEVGRLEVILLGRDGKPLPDTCVCVPSSRVRGWTDASGFVAFDRVTAGECHVVTQEAGVVETLATARVVPGQTGRITMREAEGGTVGVFVVDEEGRSLPCATLMLSRRAGQPFCDLSDDGVQRTDLFTDQFGRRTLAHVPPGSLQVGALFGDREATERIEVRDGEVTLVHLVVK